MKERSQQVYHGLDEAYSCNNVKLLELVMEHLVFHWEDIVELFIDDLLE